MLKDMEERIYPYNGRLGKISNFTVKEIGVQRYGIIDVGSHSSFRIRASAESLFSEHLLVLIKKKKTFWNIDNTFIEHLIYAWNHMLGAAFISFNLPNDHLR